jgi:hypothetical protein
MSTFSSSRLELGDTPPQGASEWIVQQLSSTSVFGSRQSSPGKGFRCGVASIGIRWLHPKPAVFPQPLKAASFNTQFGTAEELAEVVGVSTSGAKPSFITKQLLQR